MAPLPQPRHFDPKVGGYLGIALTIIAGFEGLYTFAYKDIVGVKTVCYGHIEGVQMGDKYTVEQCRDMLVTDLPRYEAMVNKCIHVPMPDKRKAAIVSFTYNVGGGALCKSSVARKLNAGDVRGGCDALLLYNKAGGKTVKGLVNRRQAERKLCLEEGPTNAPAPIVTPTPKPAPIVVKPAPVIAQSWPCRWFGIDCVAKG